MEKVKNPACPADNENKCSAMEAAETIFQLRNLYSENKLCLACNVYITLLTVAAICKIAKIDKEAFLTCAIEVFNNAEDAVNNFDNINTVNNTETVDDIIAKFDPIEDADLINFLNRESKITETDDEYCLEYEVKNNPENDTRIEEKGNTEKIDIDDLSKKGTKWFTMFGFGSKNTDEDNN